MGLYPPDRTLIDVNDYQHDKMINTDFYRDILRQVYPGQDADFTNMFLMEERKVLQYMKIYLLMNGVK